MLPTIDSFRCRIFKNKISFFPKFEQKKLEKMPSFKEYLSTCPEQLDVVMSETDSFSDRVTVKKHCEISFGGTVKVPIKHHSNKLEEMFNASPKKLFSNKTMLFFWKKEKNTYFYIFAKYSKSSEFCCCRLHLSILSLNSRRSCCMAFLKVVLLFSLFQF